MTEVFHNGRTYRLNNATLQMQCWGTAWVTITPNMSQYTEVMALFA